MQQQNPPRFPFEQRTRAGLLLFMGTLRLYTKQALSISEQIELLKSRGLNIADSSKAEKFLGEVSYFLGFVQYLRPMEEDKTTHQFKPNSRFEDAVALYNFDIELRFDVQGCSTIRDCFAQRLYKSSLWHMDHFGSLIQALLTMSTSLLRI